MKKIMLLFSGVILSAMSFAQFSFGVQAHGSLSSARVKNQYDINYDRSMHFSQGGGVVVQYDLNDHISFRGSADYLQQGATLTYSPDELSVTSKFRLNYVQVPLHVLYNVQTFGVKFYAGLGGYAAYGFSGHSINTLRYSGSEGEPIEIKEKVKAFGKDTEDGNNFKRMDMGLSGIAGVQLRNNLFVQAGYQYGLTNLNRDNEDKFRNNGLRLTVGYFF